MQPRVRAMASCALAASAVLLGAGCLEYSPHALPTDPSERDLHAKALLRLESAPSPEVLKFAVIGDTQLHFDEARAAVAAANRIDGLSFVVQIGDFTHVGLLAEYRQMVDVFDSLSAPYFVVIGNHDILGNGRAIYEQMFGPVNTAFAFAGTRFLLLDSNSREVGFDGSVPNLAWLSSTLALPAPQYPTRGDAALLPDPPPPAVVFAHVAADSEEFDAALGPAFGALLRDSGARASFHGHEHRFRSGVHEEVPFHVASGVESRAFLVAAQRADGGFDVERVSF